MPLLAEIPKLLEAFLGLLTQPFEQSPADSLRGAGTSITLAGAFAGIGQGTVVEATPPSLTLVVVWMAVSAVVAKADRRGLEIARNVSVISFWIAVTSAFILAAEQVYPDPFDRGPRFYFVAGWLLLVPVHMFRSLSFWRAVVMTSALLVSAGFLAASLIY